jgi:hypothetical protein
MPQPTDSTGAYTGLAYRKDADLRAWLEKRPREAALEPNCTAARKVSSTVPIPSQLSFKPTQAAAHARREPQPAGGFRW